MRATRQVNTTFVAVWMLKINPDGSLELNEMLEKALKEDQNLRDKLRKKLDEFEGDNPWQLC